MCAIMYTVANANKFDAVDLRIAHAQRVDPPPRENRDTSQLFRTMTEIKQYVYHKYRKTANLDYS